MIFTSNISNSKKNMMRKFTFTQKAFSFLAVMLFAFQSLAQVTTSSISGLVADAKGEGLPGATVVVKGTSKGVVADFDGNYSISAKQGDVLVISYAGSTQSVTVGAGNTYNVKIRVQPSSIGVRSAKLKIDHN